MAACVTTYFEGWTWLGLKNRRAQRSDDGAAGSASPPRAHARVYFAKHFDNTRLVKASDPVRVREMRVFSAAVVALFSLIMIYGLQHFSAIESSYSVESEKQSLDQLREENRQLRLSEAELTQPGRIDQMAHQLGLAEPQPGQVIFSDAQPALLRRSCPCSGGPANTTSAIANLHKPHRTPLDMTAAVQASAAVPKHLKACPSSGRAFWLSASSFSCGPAPSPVGSSGCRSCVTRTLWNAPPGSNSAPLK